MVNLIGKLQGVEYVIYGLSYLIVMLLAFGMHEFAHAYVAYKQGDITPKVQGRVTLNPLKHIDPLGFCMCFMFGIGWAKPVQTNPYNYVDPKKSETKVCFAGVLANFTMAFIGCGCYMAMLRFANIDANYFIKFLFVMFNLMFSINLSLFVFNLLPIPPLDGYQLLVNLCPNCTNFINFMQRYGSLILLIILICMGYVLSMIIEFIGWPIMALWKLIFFGVV